jgi:hypothetical protein
MVCVSHPPVASRPSRVRRIASAFVTQLTGRRDGAPTDLPGNAKPAAYLTSSSNRPRRRPDASAHFRDAGLCQGSGRSNSPIFLDQGASSAEARPPYQPSIGGFEKLGVNDAWSIRWVEFRYPTAQPVVRRPGQIVSGLPRTSSGKRTAAQWVRVPFPWTQARHRAAS